MRAAAVSLLDPACYRRTPWKNGGGVTIDIAAEYRPGADPAGWTGMIWRFGHTRIERPGPFSDLSGHDRVLAVIEGGGLVLHPRGHAAIDVRAPYQPVRFPGEWAIASELTQGPVGVLNLIADRAACAIDLVFVEPGATAAISGAPCIAWALTDADLDIGGGAFALARDFAARFDAEAARSLRVRRGRIALAAIKPRR